MNYASIQSLNTDG